MIATPTRTAFLAATAGLVFAHSNAVAGNEVSPDQYRLQISSSDYKVQTDSAYQLAAEYRRPSPAPEPVHNDLPAEPRMDFSFKPFAKEIEFAALRASVDPALVHAVIHVESRYRPEAVSPKGALGLMQVMPGTAARYGVSATRPTVQKNLHVGTRYLRDLMQMFDDRLDLVLAAYNAGEGAVRKYSDKIPPYPETQSYVRAVLAKYAELGGKVVRRGHNDAPSAKRAVLISDVRARTAP